VTRGILTVLFICTTVIVQGQQSAGEIHINEVFRKTPLSKALKVIQTEYNIRIAYDHSLVQNIIVALQLNDLSIAESMERLLAGTPLTFHAVGDNIVIVPRTLEPAESSTEKMAINLSGDVLDADTEETLPQATIRVKGANIATTTNNDGRFTIFDIPGDTCLLEIMYLGYITQTVRVQDVDKPDQLRIRLRNDTKILNEVVVLDEYNQAVHLEEEPGTAVFNPRSLSSLPSLGEQDMARTLQLMPGVAATDESSSGMVIRGSHSSYNLTLLDGMTIYQQDHFFGSFSIINADIIKDVRVHKGMFDAKYGSRVSGVVDITTKNGNAVKPAFDVKLNLINAKATAEIPIGRKWSLFAGARRSFTDLVQSNLFTTLFDIARISNDQIQIFRFEGLGGKITPRYYFYDANTKLTFRPTPRDNISLSFYVSRDHMLIGDSISFHDDNDRLAIKRDETTRWGNNGLSLRWGRQWGEHYYSNIRISGSRFFRRYDFDQQITVDTMDSDYKLTLNNSIRDLSYAIDNEWVLHSKLSFEFGLAGTRQETGVRIQDKYVVSGDVPPDEIPEDSHISEEEHSWLHSAYGSIIMSPTAKFTASAGARLVYYYNHAGKPYFEPRLTTRYKITEPLNLKAGYGRSNQFITQLFYHSPTGSISGIHENFWMLSDPGDIRSPVISADHFTAGITLKRKRFVYDAEVYYKVNHGVIIDEDLNSGRTDMYGLDVMLQKTTGIHTGWIAYSISQGTQTHPYILNGRSAPSWQDQRHELKVINMLMLGNWNLSSTLIYGSGKPYPRYTVRYHRDGNGMLNGYGLLLDYNNQSRLPAYFRIDLAASYTIKFKNSSKIEVGVSIHNITDHRNIKTRRIDAENLDEALSTNTELPATYNDIVLLGFSPSLSLNVSF
jgi:ferric enterobactin receptor